jgi:hypothetical protein
MDLKTFQKTLKDFTNSLPKTNVSFLYFVKDISTNTFIPRLNTTATEWKVRDIPIPLYVIPGIRGDGYLYVYRESDIRYQCILDEDCKVHGIHKFSLLSAPISGGSLATNVNWGDHLTIGVERSFATGNIMLMTHKTKYFVNPSNPSEYQRESITCNTQLINTIEEDSKCLEMGRPSQHTLEIYRTLVDDKYAFRIIKHIHTILWKGVSQGGGKRRSRMKGGADIIDGRTKYFTESFIQFINSIALVPILSIRSTLTECIVIYEGGTHIVVRYNFGDHSLALSNVFILEIESLIPVWRVFQIPERQRTPHQVQTLQTFKSYLQGLVAH